MQRVIVSLLLLSVCAFAAPTQQQESSQLLSPSQPQSQRASDLVYSPIRSVTDEDRYMVVHPDTKLTALKKVKHAKGNMVFSSGERISGDKLLANNYDDESFTSTEDVEVDMSYTSKSGTAITLTSVEIYVDTTADDASAFFTDGGIGKSTASILLACNQTRTFSYEAFFYGY